MSAPQPGSHECVLRISGVEVVCTYELDGDHFAADENGPEEFPAIELVSVDFGGGPVYGVDVGTWDDLLNLTALLEDQTE